MSDTVSPPKSIQLHWLMAAVGLVPGLSLENVVWDSVSRTTLLEAESFTLNFCIHYAKYTVITLCKLLNSTGYVECKGYRVGL